MQALKQSIEKLAGDFYDEIVAIRRHIHQNPELSWEEVKTAEFICRKLDEYGIPYKKGIAKNGIVALIEGKDPQSKNIALRADMDALPVTELNETEYKSRVPGTMHACGHDVHMACLLGAAKILHTLKNEFSGSVKLLFQPSEETYPGGAIGMINEGVLKNPDTTIVIGQHVINTLDAGDVGLKAGPYMASTDEVYLTIKGKGGHAATPEQVIDPILVASHIIIALQQIVSRNANPVVPTVLSFGKIIGEGRTNVIPDQVLVAGTIRTYDETWRKTIHSTIRHMATSMAVAMGAECDVRIDHGYPYLENNPSVTEKVRGLATEYLGGSHVKELEQRMTSEDFSYFANAVPSCFYRLGIRNTERGIVSNLHTATFDVDESAIRTGMGVMAFVAVGLLQ